MFCGVFKKKFLYPQPVSDLVSSTFWTQDLRGSVAACKTAHLFLPQKVVELKPDAAAVDSLQAFPFFKESVLADLNSLYPIVPNGISALFYDKTYFWHARRTAIAQRPQ